MKFEEFEKFIKVMIPCFKVDSILSINIHDESKFAHHLLEEWHFSLA